MVPETTRKLMNPATEAQFFHLLMQFCENNVNDLRVKILKSLVSTRNLQLSTKGIAQFRQECSEKLKPVLETLMQQQNKLWADMWVFVVEQMGTDLHTDNKFLNNMLSVLEGGMKRKDSDSIKWSLSCWQVLINNFALSQKMITAPRRVALLTIPLKAKNVRDIDVLEMKFRVWWHLFVALGKQLDMHAETVSKPFLLFTFGPFEQESSHLLNKFPSIAKTALMYLTSFVATGIADEDLGQIETDFKSPAPLICDGKAFLCLTEWIVKSINVLLKQPEELPIRPLEILLAATLDRIVLLCGENLSFGSDMLALYLTMLKETLVGQILMRKVYKELLISTIEAAVSKLPANLLDTKLKNIEHNSPRDYMFSLLCNQEHLLMHAKPGIVKTDERQCSLLGKLLIVPGTLVVQPNSLFRAMKLVNALGEMQRIAQGEVARKCFHLWEQCSRFLHKFPREYLNKEANELGQEMFLKLLLMPFRLILDSSSADVIASISTENTVVNALKNLFFNYSEIVHLSLSVNKQDPCEHIYSKIVTLLKVDKYPPATFQTIVRVICKFVSARSSLNYTKFFARTANHGAESAELKLLSRLTELLCNIAPDSPSVAGKMTPYIAKSLENLVLLVNSSDFVIEAINLFYNIFTSSPVNYWPNNRMEVTDPWTSLVAPFKKIWVAESEKKMPYLLELKPRLETLIDHPDVKVCNAAKEMLARYTLNINGDSLSTSFEAPSKTPVVLRGKQPRKRSFLASQTPPPVVSQTSSPTSQKISPGKPSLEDLDSQDFVKIPSQPKMKKPLTPHQREVKKRRRDDIPALYQGLSQDTQQSQDTQDESPVVELPRPPLFATSVWDEEAVDIDIARRASQESDENVTSQESDENKCANIQGVFAAPTSDEDSKKLKDSEEIELVENSQMYATVPIQTEPKPDPEQAALLQMMRARNRQGVSLPSVKSGKEQEPSLVEKEAVAPVNKRKSLPPVRGAGLRGRAAHMVGLVTTKETPAPQEPKQAEGSAPQQLMSSLKALSEAKVEICKQNDSSPAKTSSTSSVLSTPVSSSRKRSNLKKDKSDDTPSPKRSKRVSFAEPVVSGQQDSPTILQDLQIYNSYYKQSPTTKKKLKASRKLLMIPKDGFQLVKEHISQGSLEQEERSELEGPIEPALENCLTPIADIAHKLSSPMLLEEFVTQMRDRNINTVHDLNMLSELVIADLPVKEPKIAHVKSVLKELADAMPTNEQEEEEEEEEEDVTTEIEALPPSQPETIPSITTVTTHQDTIPVIEEVITSPENDSPVEATQPNSITNVDVPNESPSPTEDMDKEPLLADTKEKPIITEEHVEKEADQQMNEVADDNNSQGFVESSLEMDRSVKADIPMENKDAEPEVVIISQSSEESGSPPRPIPKTAEELFLALSETEKDKFRNIFLQQEESHALLAELEKRQENILASKSNQEVVKEIKSRCKTSEILQLLDEEEEIQLFAEKSMSLTDLMSRKPAAEVAAGITLFSETNLQDSIATINKILNGMESSNLSNIFSDIEMKVCDSLPHSTIENRARDMVKTNTEFMQSLLVDLESPLLAKSVADRCSTDQITFTDGEASSIYTQIKSQVTDNDTAEELLQRLESKLDQGKLKIGKSTDKLKNFFLDNCKQEEILSRLHLVLESCRAKVAEKISSEDLLVMTAAKLHSQKSLAITRPMLNALEQLSVYMHPSSIEGLLKSKTLDEDVVVKCIKVLMERTCFEKVLDQSSDNQVVLILEALLKNEEKRKKLMEMIFSMIKDGEMMQVFGKKRLIDMMTVGVLSGDIEPMKAIFDVFCNSHIVEAACEILRDGATDPQLEMLKKSFPRHILALWISEIILK